MIFGVGESILVRGLSRGPTSPKHMPRGWNKGRGVKNVGFVSRKGNFIVQSWKVPQWQVPDLTDFELKPYVGRKKAEASDKN